MINPNPARITDPMWRLWTDRPNPIWKLGGIYANKEGYHNTVNANLANWSMNYSVRLSLDLGNSNRDKARAIDLTMSDKEMVKWTTNMKKSALDPNDPRLDGVRDFYGTLDNKTVYGLIKDSITGAWRPSSANKTHLWHGHMSIFTAFVNDWTMLKPILSVWRGESLQEWRINKMQLPRKGDSGESVRFWQHTHNQVRKLYNPPLVEIKVDGDYGPATAAAFLSFWKTRGGVGGYDASYLSGWCGLQYMRALSELNQPAPQQSNFSPEQIKEIVEQWLEANVTTSFDFNGQVEGRITPR